MQVQPSHQAGDMGARFVDPLGLSGICLNDSRGYVNGDIQFLRVY